MQTSPTLSEPARGSIRARGGVAHDVARLVGETPLYTLRRSGRGRAHLKLEHMQPGGSYFDRVAGTQLIGTGPGDTAVVAGATAFAVSAAMLSARRGVSLTVVLAPDERPRLRELLRRLGATVRRADVPDLLARECADAGDVLLRRDDPTSHLLAVRDIGRELRAALARPLVWVLIDHGVSRERVARALSVDATPADVVFVADDDERERQPGGHIASRRTQMGHREGLLLGPAGAEVADRTIELAEDGERDVVGIVPDGGHRYLGWW